MMLLPVDTPDMPALVPKWPTTSMSTAPYMACKICAPSMGIINCIILPKMLPLVKSCLASMTHSLLAPVIDLHLILNPVIITESIGGLP